MLLSLLINVVFIAIKGFLCTHSLFQEPSIFNVLIMQFLILAQPDSVILLDWTRRCCSVKLELCSTILRNRTNPSPVILLEEISSLCKEVLTWMARANDIAPLLLISFPDTLTPLRIFFWRQTLSKDAPSSHTLLSEISRKHIVLLNLSACKTFFDPFLVNLFFDKLKFIIASFVLNTLQITSMHSSDIQRLEISSICSVWFIWIASRSFMTPTFVTLFLEILRSCSVLFLISELARCITPLSVIVLSHKWSFCSVVLYCKPNAIKIISRSLISQEDAFMKKGLV